MNHMTLLFLCLLPVSLWAQTDVGDLVRNAVGKAPVVAWHVSFGKIFPKNSLNKFIKSISTLLKPIELDHQYPSAHQSPRTYASFSFSEKLQKLVSLLPTVLPINLF